MSSLQLSAEPQHRAAVRLRPRRLPPRPLHSSRGLLCPEAPARGILRRTSPAPYLQPDMPPPLPPSPALRSAPLGSARLGEQPPVSFRRSLQGTRKGTWRCAPYPSAGVTPAPPRQQELNSTWGHPGPDCKTPPKAGILVTRGRGSHHPELKLLPRPHCQGKSGASLQSGAAAPLTPVKPRPFLVVLATAVASQDGVVAAGYSVRNCRTRPGAEQRLLPVVDHSDSGKYEPRVPVSPDPPFPARPGPRDAGRSRQTATVACRKRRVPAHSERSPLVTSAPRPESRFSPRGRLVPGEPSLPPPQCRPLPFLPPGFLPVAFPPRAGEKQASLLACRLTSAWEGGKERLSQVSQGGAGRGRKGRSLQGRT